MCRPKLYGSYWQCYHVTKLRVRQLSFIFWVICDSVKSCMNRDFKISNCFGIGGWNLALSWGGRRWSFHHRTKGRRRWDDDGVVENEKKETALSVSVVAWLCHVLMFRLTGWIREGLSVVTVQPPGWLVLLWAVYKNKRPFETVTQNEWMFKECKLWFVNKLDKVFMSLHYMCCLSSSLGGIIGILLCFSDSGGPEFRNFGRRFVFCLTMAVSGVLVQKS